MVYIGREGLAKIPRENIVVFRKLYEVHMLNLANEIISVQPMSVSVDSLAMTSAAIQSLRSARPGGVRG